MGKNIIIRFFFVSLFITGLFIFDDYGMSWDELAQYQIGRKAAMYIFEGDDSYLSFKDRDYGVIFEIPLTLAEKFFQFSTSRSIFLMRHLAIFISFFIALIFFYMLLEKYFNDWKYALFGTLFLILSPRIFSHSFYNSKDIVFLSAGIIFLYSAYNLALDFTYRNIILHSFVCAAAIGIRIMGVIFLFLTFVLLTMEFAGRIYNRQKWKKITGISFLYIILTIIFTVILWPYLWNSPLKNFITAIDNMKNFRWPGSVLFMGKMIKAVDLPVFYLPVWMLITIPLPYTILFFTGVYVFARKNILYFFKKSDNRSLFQKVISEQKFDIIVFLYFLIPFLSVIVFHSVIYDGWRQMFFIYPGFIIIAAAGLKYSEKPITGLMQRLYKISSVLGFLKNFKYRFPGIFLFLQRMSGSFHFILAAFCLIVIFCSMLRLHPYQNVYFNILVPSESGYLKSHFELDYWGLSYRKAFEYILENDNSSVIKVGVSSFAGHVNRLILTPDSQRRLEIVSGDDFDYYIDNFRVIFQKNKKVFNDRSPVKSIKAADIIIADIYKFKE